MNAGAAPAVGPPTPILFVRDVTASAGFYRDRLGFQVDLLYGSPPYYGSVSRGGACLHLRHVESPNFAELAAREPALIVASITVTGVEALEAELAAAGAEITQRLTPHAWGGTDFHVRDPDGNTFSFVEFAAG
jgi:catechol 2,3-dioxygenase-like lactoylglutathione lyase family enzyme